MSQDTPPPQDPGQRPGGYPPQQPYQPQPYQQQPYGSAPATAEDPGRTLGIVGLVLALVLGGLPGLIVSLIALRKSKKAGFKNTPALIGLILGIVVTVVWIVVIILAVAAGAAAYNALIEACQAAGPGERVTVNGTPVSCPG